MDAKKKEHEVCSFCKKKKDKKEMRCLEDLAATDSPVS